MFYNLTTELKALLLFFFILSTNFLVSTLGNNIIETIKDNHFLEYIIIFFTIFFCVDLSNKYSHSPIYIFKNTILIFLFYLIITKQTKEMFLINLILLITLYIISAQ